MLVETAEAIASEVSDRLDEILGFRALIGAHGNFIASLASPKSIKLRGLLAAHDRGSIARPETPQGQAAVAADQLWRKFAEALASDPRAGLAL